MKKYEKEIARLRSRPRDYSYAEAAALLSKLGYIEDTRGRTSGSAVVFRRLSDGKKIFLHKPHPQKILKDYQIKNIISHLQENGDI